MSAIVLRPNEDDIYRIVHAVRQLIEGRSNAIGTVTLTASSTTTTVSDAVNCGADSAVFLFPQTASAAAAMTVTYIASATVIAGQFIITHDSDAAVDRTFSYICLG